MELRARVFWPGSEVEIQGMKPDYYIPYDNSISNQKRAEQILTWLQMPEPKRPHFLTLYFSTVDTAGHMYGPDAQEVQKAIYEVDEVLQWLEHKLKSEGIELNTIIVSDHGMLDVSKNKKIDISKLVSLTNDKVRFIGEGPFTYAYFENKDLLKKYFNILSKNPHLKVYKRKKFPLIIISLVLFEWGI